MSSRAMDVRLEFRDRSTHSFWHLVLEGAERTLTAGKVGAKKAPKPKTKTFKSEEAARKSAAKDIAKKRAEGYFDPTSIADVLAYHREHLAIPSDADIAAHRASLPHASEDYFQVYATGALSIGFFSDFAPRAPRAPNEMTGLFLASSAADELDDEAAALDPYFHIVGHYSDGSWVVQLHQGEHAGRLSLVENGGDELVEHLDAGDPDAVLAAWIDAELMEPVWEQTFSELVLELLLHYQGAAYERTRDLRQALAAVTEAIAGDPLAITELDLSSKGLRVIPDIVGECANLEVLVLRKNELEEVPPVVRRLEKLQVLDLYYNAIPALPDWLAELPLRELNLGINRTETFPAVVARIPTLETLVLAGTDGLPAAIGDLTQLQSLAVAGTAGPIEPGGLARLGNLRTLGLGRLAAPLPEDIGQLAALEELSFTVADPAAMALPESLGELSSLRVLRADKATLPSSLGRLAALEELKVSGNEGGLPDGLCELAALRVLDLHYARITSLPEGIGRLGALETLNLEATYLETLPASFAELTSLRTLNLATAAERTILGDRIAGLTGLELLALPWRVVATIEGSFAGLRSLKTLKVFSKSGDDPADADRLLALARELPALETLSVPYAFKDTFRAALPGVTI